MDTSKLMQAGLAGLVLFGIWKFAPNPTLKVAAVAAGAVIAGKVLPIPYVTPLLQA